MKKQSFLLPFLALFLLLSSLLFGSCGKKPKNDGAYRVVYSAGLDGAYQAPYPELSYSDAAGKLQTITLSPGTPWRLEFESVKGYQMTLSMSGTLADGGGHPWFVAEGYKGSNLIVYEKHEYTSDFPTPFEMNFTDTLKESH